MNQAEGFNTGRMPNFADMFARGQQTQSNAVARRADPTYVQQKPRPKLHPYAPTGPDPQVEYARRRSVAADQQQRIHERVAADAAIRAKATHEAAQERQQAAVDDEVDYRKEQAERQAAAGRLRKRLRREYG